MSAAGLHPEFIGLHRAISGMKVPVVACGRLVVISGILAGGTLGFRNVLFCFCTFSGPFVTVMFSCLFVLHEVSTSSAHKLLFNLHRVILST